MIIVLRIKHSTFSKKLFPIATHPLLFLGFNLVKSNYRDIKSTSQKHQAIDNKISMLSDKATILIVRKINRSPIAGISKQHNSELSNII
jgi:hypothetical protein